ncbi:chaperone dnaJ 6 [Magnaporthiopsis poae ATCC 64411]|uniref:Chaperone dnaJ 6 n=1 Tax=Magnaporthiopsis poae (strain ATCC 64411 / 73-15) TaxID=644358 RepID=A0A0C4EEC6_MAGP6|nr:chaperone dnaJ 6 [Magnaporthiopsis poae ATCC 64411]
MADSSDELEVGEPPVIDPYEELGLERSATADQVKAAYRKAALKHHPDKAAADKKASAHEKFQSIAFAYAILSDPARRKRYDETGSTAESIVDSDGFSWSDYFAEQFRDAVSADAIDRFASKYKRSDEERDDVLAAYEEGEGDMSHVYEVVMLSSVLEDDDRFRAIIDAAIAAGTVGRYDAYAKETKASRRARAKNATREQEEAEDYAKELGVHDKLFGGGGGGDKGGKSAKGNGKGKGKGKGKSGEVDESALAALITKRQADRGGSDFLDRLAEKYGAQPKRGKKRGSAEVDEPPEEAFQATAARKEKKQAPAPKASRSKRVKR